MSTTTISAQRLVEHRYGQSLATLQQSPNGDPVLSVVLRRLDSLEAAEEQARAARARLSSAWQQARAGAAGAERLTLLSAAEVGDADRHRAAQAQALLDLLDVSLLIGERPGTAPGGTERPSAACGFGQEGLLDLARRVTAGQQYLSRDSLRCQLRRHGVRASNRRLGDVLHQLRAERCHRH
jgi:hypothetical protein